METVRKEISTVPVAVRAGVFAVAAAGSLAWGAVIGSSPSEAFHLAVVPVLACWALLFRPSLFRQIAPRHLVYFTVLALAVGGYLLSFARLTSQAPVSWTEIPLALYFLLALHLVVYLIDRAVVALLKLVARGAGSRGRLVPVGLAAVRIVLVAALSAPYLTATFLVHWVKFADVTDPRELAGMEYEPVRFDSSDALSITGWWIPRRKAASDSTVILVGGRCQSKASFLVHAQVLGEAGYHVLMPDLRGSGRSQGHTRSFGSLEGRDVLGALRYLKAVRPSQSRHVFVMGIGEGATAALAAASRDNRIEAVVLDSPCGGADAAVDQLAGLLPGPLDGAFRRASLAVASAALGCDVTSFDAGDMMACLHDRPVLIIQGLDDSISPPGRAEELCRRGAACADSPAGLKPILWRVPLAGYAQSVLLTRFHYGRNVRTLFESVRRDSPELLRLIDPEEF